VPDLFDAGSAAQLAAPGVTSIPGLFASAGAAFAAAAGVIEAVHAGRSRVPLEILGDFIIPPVDGPPSRDFQTLHFDFGLPLSPARASDIAHYTALHIPVDSPVSEARTRLVRLDALLGQRTWPDHDELLRRFAAYGETHGAWAGCDGYIEGSLARVVESAGGGVPSLPSVKLDPGFLCGNEFSTLTAELDFFTAHGLSVQAVEIEITLEPGAVTIFDNLVLAHGRRGVRQPGELRQRVFGLRAVSPVGQREVRDGLLAAFSD
jgi:hypothetical protein